MGKLTDLVMAKKIQESSGDERIKLIRKENERKMKEIRETLRKKEREQEWAQTVAEVFADPSEIKQEESIVCILSSDVLND